MIDIRNYTELPPNWRRAILNMIRIGNGLTWNYMLENTERYLPEILVEARNLRISRGWFDFGEVPTPEPSEASTEEYEVPTEDYN